MELTSFYGDLLYQTDQYPKIRIPLAKIADRMLEGLQNNQDFILQEINNYHSDYLGTPIAKLKNIKFTIKDCQTAIANEHGFKNWEVVKKLEDHYDQNFEKAVNFLIDGNFEKLKKIIEVNPQLITKKQSMDIRLHYCITQLAMA